jgi:hypothetical protein
VPFTAWSITRSHTDRCGSHRSHKSALSDGLAVLVSDDQAGLIRWLPHSAGIQPHLEEGRRYAFALCKGQPAGVRTSLESEFGVFDGNEIVNPNTVTSENERTSRVGLPV